MAVRSLPLSQLAGMGEEQRRQTLAAFAANRHQPLNGQVVAVQERIAAFEAEYELPSEAMLRQVREGRMTETEPINRWMMLLDARDRLHAAG